ncbi:hypothetical protein [Fodinibius sediminis]|uniref:Predicted lipoprotein with conserved Yx(FWY)xxD motif n=1 Tax=Fodinibius sediminis TaxID=1214077 RepID=A0A521B1A3_9BACT|nr:hypothetical protein [Fodinibius sediminis]SMO40805.1 Predicted lipoprotein with conserved Yx(FWY)xxD motif [Fodinibius sediminis]
MKLLNTLLPLSMTILVMVLTTGCSDSSTPATPGLSSEFDVQLVSTSDNGEVLADSTGGVLYIFSPDVHGKSSCVGECVENWPIFHSGQPRVGSGLEADDFTVIKRSDGPAQTTFQGWPLYYFSGDEQPGTVNGDGINDAWYVAKANYSVMIASQQLVGHDDRNYMIDESGRYVEGEGVTSHLVDAEGRTLYIFINDSANTNNFTAEDFSNNGVWPIYEIEPEAVPSTLNSELFGSISVYGRQQLTYKGWPLYYFGQDDMQRGNTRGVSFSSPGIWPVAQKGMDAAPGYQNNDSSDGPDDPGY